jgi:TalC/MipB family fructose-6-phosphate aldolase
MELFIDSVRFDEISAAAELGFVEGATTTPTFMYRDGVKDVNGVIVELAKLPVRQVHVEVLGNGVDEMIVEAERLASLPGMRDKACFKIPVTWDGCRAARRLTDAGYRVNLHLVYTLNQAYMAALSGAAYICMLVGRLEDQGMEPWGAIEETAQMLSRYGFASKLMVASVRTPDHVRRAVRCGAHTVTVPWKILRMLPENLVTGRGIEDFTTHARMSSLTARQLLRSDNPVVHDGATVAEAAIQMTRSRLGAISVVNGDGTLIGILTDGDLRRSVDHAKLGAEPVGQLMSRAPKAIPEDTILSEVVDTMRKAQVDNLVVVDGNGRPVGMIDIQDLLRDGYIE